MSSHSGSHGGPKEIPAGDLRALELQADAFASRVLISLNADGGMETLFSDNPLLKTSVDWIFFSFLAAAVVFAILDLTDSLIADQRPEMRRHPSPPIRLLGVLAELQQTLHEHVPEEQQRNLFMKRVLGECRVIFELLGVETLDTPAFNTYFSSSGISPASERANELWKYISRLQEMSPVLDGMSRAARTMFGL